MTFDADRLYDLLPAVDRIRDAERGEPLRALFRVVAGQAAVLEEDLAQRYDDHFIETCAEWVVPYIGDLLGVRGLHAVSAKTLSQRAEVANTISYRRRKGTASMLQQLARDVTGWDARVVEYFLLLASSQYMNHIRRQCPGTPNLRDWQLLTYVGTAFDAVTRNADVRRIATGRGRYNIPNIGLFVWRLGAYRLQDAVPVKVDDRRYLFDPLGAPVALVTRPEAEEPATHPAGRMNVPMPIGRRALDAHLADYYGATKSIHLRVDGVDVPPAAVVACDLSDSGTAWAHRPQQAYGVDPVLGRLALPEQQPLPHEIRVTYHYAFSADMGGGEYDRGASLDSFPKPPERVPAPHATLADALGAVVAGGVAQVDDTGTYAETPSLTANGGARVELRAADGTRPLLLLAGDFTVTGGDDADVTINGLVIAGGTVRVTGTLRRIRLRHCTLVPGLSLGSDGRALHGTTPSLVIEAPDVQVEIDASILGGIRSAIGSSVRVTNSIIDATADDGVAYAALDSAGPGGELRVTNCTLVGKVHADVLPVVTNSILLATLSAGDSWHAAVWSERCQQGCVRYSYLPAESLAPRRFHCQPDATADPLAMRPQFTSRRYGDAGYCQLDGRTPAAIRQGADDESEMGVFHDVLQARREANLRARLDEYLRFGLEAGVFHAT